MNYQRAYWLCGVLLWGTLTLQGYRFVWAEARRFLGGWPSYDWMFNTTDLDAAVTALAFMGALVWTVQGATIYFLNRRL